MRIKIADTWHEVKLGTPIMIELSQADRRNIANMAPTATKYACFADGEPMSVDQKRDWMDG
ncbi:hypothetical protein [Sphingomonas desiccabilis]|uniref:Uncharacterized protein n=1 Tax=Sphingomonas desiccabilis TaxID=429134 RepID=A0A4Q2J251_9SPHN|nr:hypothetical protein [Sphingomonas desiccabilis]MBB3910847.1 hypothetical protein [Sphingomonas desiccabilis]RXZ35452.1 hypothetical protein EO081_07495 [Sphingomonas desiccabilis]